MKRLILGLLAACTLSSIAELKKNPDENTFWEMRKTNLQQWASGVIKVENTADGGFSIGDENPSPKAGHSIYRRLDINKAYPWLVFEISKFEEYKGYRTWHFGVRDMKALFGSVTNTEAGIVAINCYENAPKVLPDGPALFWAYFFDVRAFFTYMKMVKKPDYYIEATSAAFAEKKSFGIGDKVKFTVYLKETAEEVSLKLRQRDYLYDIQVNGNGSLNLKPEDPEQKIWSTEVTIEKLVVNGKTPNFSRCDILMRATVLGGDIEVPVYGMINYPYSSK